MFWQDPKASSTKKTYYTELKTKHLADLEEMIKSKNTLIMLHMHGCWHCQTFKPTFNEFAKTMRKEKKDMQILGIEAEVLRKLSETNKKVFTMVTTTSKSPSVYFPKVIAFKCSNNKIAKKEFEADRTIAELSKFCGKVFPEAKAVVVSSSSVKKQGMNEQLNAVPNYSTASLEKVLKKYMGF